MNLRTKPSGQNEQGIEIRRNQGDGRERRKGNTNREGKDGDYDSGRP